MIYQGICISLCQKMRMSFKVLRIAVFISVCYHIDLSSAAFTKDSGCGVTKGCFSDCDSGCTYLIAWSNRTATVSFKIQVELSAGTADQYGAFGLSSTQSMDATSVTSCLMTNSGGTFNYGNSYNTAYSNDNSGLTNPTNGLSSLTGSYTGNVLTCEFERTKTNTDPLVFDLETDWYILYAKGSISGGSIGQHSASNRAFSSVKVDLQSNEDLAAGVDKKIKAHGSVAIVAWMILANLGYFIARYYKPLWSGKQIFGADIWFLIHRILMIGAAILTIISFGLIIHGHFNVGDNNFERSHPYLGILVLCFVIINPIVGLLRPDKESKYRPVFYWVHYCIGAGVLILALINIFIGIRLEKSATSDKAYYIFIAYEVFQVSMIIVLEVLNIVGKHQTKDVNPDTEMKPVSEEDKSNQKQEETTPYAWTPKLILLCIHIVVTIILPFAMVGIVVTSTSSSD